MKKLAILAAAGLLALAGCGDESDSKSQSAAKVSIADFKFVPEEVRVKAGGTVTWTNSDKAAHTAEADPGQPGPFDTGTLRTGDSKEVKLDKPGTYSYFCAFHRFMTARVRVVE